MKKTLLFIAIPAASFLAGCGSPGIVARTEPGRPSIIQVSEGYDTVGRKWADDASRSGGRMERIYPSSHVVTKTTTTTTTTTAQNSAQPAEVTIEPAPQQTFTRSESVNQTYTGTITDIDYPGREVTLKDSDGQTQTFSVSPDVQRFNEAKVGDKVAMNYYCGLNAEVRKPTPEEQQNPLTVLQATGRTEPGQDPNAATARQIRALVTIEALNRANQTITVKGPRGNYYTALVADPSRFDDVHIGDSIVMTFTEALAVSLDPAE